jgi:hypothetical protein
MSIYISLLLRDAYLLTCSSGINIYFPAYLLTCSLRLEAGDLGHDLCKGVPGVGERSGHRLQLHQERDKNSALADYIFHLSLAVYFILVRLYVLLKI